MNFPEHLAQEVERTGHTVKRGDSSFIVEPINLKSESEIGGRNEHNVNGQHSVVIQISIKATNEQLFPGGIWDCLAGVGENDDEAFSYAAQVWTAGIFEPIHELFVSTETKDFQVQKLNLVSRNDETGEEFAWKLYLGALQAAGQFVEREDNLDTAILAKKMLNAITSELYEKKWVWIKAFICKMPDGSIDGNCWLNNQDWIEGLNALYEYVEEWKDIKSYASVKQFMLIKPCEWSEIKNPESLRKALPPRKKQDFLSKWFGK